MTFCKVQECKITTKFNTFFSVCNSAFLFLFKMKQYTEIFFFFTVFKIHTPAITFEIVTGLSKIKKNKKCSKLKTACGHGLRYTQARALYQACLPPKWTMLEKLILALFNIVLVMHLQWTNSIPRKKCFSGSNYHIKQRSHLKYHSTVYLQKKQINK